MRSVRYIGKADQVSLGPDTVQQALPIRHFEQYDPFLLLHHFDKEIPPGGPALDVAPHPHRGFEPVTFLFDGAIHHRDSRGNEGLLDAGDVQWMTAGMGIVHSEAAQKQWMEKGGRMQLIQLWVNLPAKDKMVQPRYQDIKATDIPVYEEESGLHMRVIAGNWNNLNGPAVTHTELIALHGKLEKGAATEIPLPETHNALLYIMEGMLEFNGKHQAAGGFIALMEKDGANVTIKALQSSSFVLLSGEPINEPLATYGPFVMNSQTEIMEAIRDYQIGKMGMLTY
jgi:redox-sensitive bicupin YhaK (pirin superfamily)